MSHVSLLITEGLVSFKDYCAKSGRPVTEEGIYVKVDLKESEVGLFLQEIAKRNIIYSEISVDKPTLEDYFLQTLQVK